MIKLVDDAIKPQENCLGLGIAKDCEEAGGQRVNLSDHMRQVWSEIGFNPTSFSLPDTEDTENVADKPILEGTNFNRLEPIEKCTNSDMERFNGIRINNFQLSMSEQEIVDFLCKEVSSEITDEKVKIIKHKKTSSVIIEGLDSEVVIEILNKIDFSITKKVFNNFPLYCRPIRDMTPVKDA